MQFNQYNVYSFQAGDLQNACDDKILVDLKRLNAINEFDDVAAFVDKVFGEFEDTKVFNYPNNVVVEIQKEENVITVIATQDKKRIMGERWRFVPNETEK